VVVEGGVATGFGQVVQLRLLFGGSHAYVFAPEPARTYDWPRHRVVSLPASRAGRGCMVIDFNTVSIHPLLLVTSKRTPNVPGMLYCWVGGFCNVEVLPLAKFQAHVTADVSGLMILPL